uniref:RING-CH-type domain-containing protein n=1 Tax=Chenopodium quinoa TaxID=63459 RepID=A0A803M3L4_CHEQI
MPTLQTHVINIDQGIPRRSSAGGGEDSDEESVRCSDEDSSSSSSSESCTRVIVVGVGEVVGVAVHLSKVERDCRICHMSLDGSNPESGFPIELGCSCKEDLAAAHKHCAEAWFKIRGNKTCEICGSTARNVVGVNEVEVMEQWNEAQDPAPTAPPPHPSETRHFWQGHRFLNFLLACMVFAFVISWLFHFNVPS